MKKTKFNKKELSLFNDLIKNKIKEEKDKLKSVKKLRSDHKKYKTSLDLKKDKDNSVIRNAEMLKNMENRSKKLLSNLENAQKRIKNKTYGICQKTGKMISKRRLLVKPEATKCIKR